jgi:hypothetical protein
MKEVQQVTKAICNKGFSGISSILPRIKFRVCGQVTAPQSLTAHSLNRYLQAEKPTAYFSTFGFCLLHIASTVMGKLIKRHSGQTREPLNKYFDSS